MNTIQTGKHYAHNIICEQLLATDHSKCIRLYPHFSCLPNINIAKAYEN
jgi:hypothetical protein